MAASGRHNSPPLEEIHTVHTSPPLQVRLYAAPPTEITSQWQRVADITAMYKTHMAALGWEV